jgi:hypothetical protein
VKPVPGAFWDTTFAAFTTFTAQRCGNCQRVWAGSPGRSGAAMAMAPGWTAVGRENCSGPGIEPDSARGTRVGEDQKSRGLPVMQNEDMAVG